MNNLSFDGTHVKIDDSVVGFLWNGRNREKEGPCVVFEVMDARSDDWKVIVIDCMGLGLAKRWIARELESKSMTDVIDAHGVPDEVMA